MASTRVREMLLGSERRWRIAVLLAVVLVAPLALPAPSAAQTAGAFTDGAELWTESDCTGEVPVVVGSDTKAQSDIYSAITLAGVIGTDCVILAGPRDGDMPASQRARLGTAAAGGYIVGGTSAVRAAKTAGRAMTRLAGADRWATAQLVGSEARSLAGGNAPAAPAPGTSLATPGDVQQPGVYLGGAEPWIAPDCTGDVPIVVGSDAKAQSDIYSAVTLAGVTGTDCVILAGPRDGDMPASQRARLDDADEGVYVVGGTAAVSDAKLHGHRVHRVGGADRWATARLVGSVATDLAAGRSPEFTPVDMPPVTADSAGFTAVAAGPFHSCAIRADRTLACWGSDHPGLSLLDAPSGSFTAISGGGSGEMCAIRTDGTLACWGLEPPPDGDGTLPPGLPRRETAPSGEFTAVSAGREHLACAIRTDGTLTCWGRPFDREALDVPSGRFTAVTAAAGGCAIRADQTLACWGRNDPAVPESSGNTLRGVPSGRFTAISTGQGHQCAIRTDGTLTCWGRDEVGQASPPSGRFTAIAVGRHHGCAIRTNKTLACWGDDRRGQASPPSGHFIAIAAGHEHSCAIHTDGTLACWGRDDAGQASPPSK